MITRAVRPAILSLALLLLASCTQLTPRDIALEDPARQQQLRTLQTHAFAVDDRIKMLRAVITTLQDLDFVINRADSRLGFISATKLDRYSLEISVLVDHAEPERMLVRVSLPLQSKDLNLFGTRSTDDNYYQAFFASLQKNLFP
jgi:hypothetical protein